ncbi:MAG: RsmE family RNA methyltransferase [Saprospiraceae bacterium]
MHFLYSETTVLNDAILLDGEEAQHALVLRLKKDEKISILNGKGKVYLGTGEQLRKKSFLVQIESVTETLSSPFNLHIAIAPTKQIDRFEWFLEKATELGVQTITPLLCDHGERERLNLDRLKKILIASIKQSGRPWLPVLNDPKTFDEFLNENKSETTYLAHAEGKLLQHQNPLMKTSICVCIGPEGDFSDRELILADQLGASRISFGPYRLRTETAGLLAVAYFAQWNT